ncbi:MAG: hypothetical protein ABI740_03520 [Alphaproteobacteria bacterium]
MTRTAIAIAASLTALACVAGLGSAAAQVITTNSNAPSANLEAPPPDVERVAGPGLPPGVGREGVRIVRPGAMLFASYDANHDGKITDAEIEAGAASSFAVADKNNDGAIAGFEQTDWATLVGGASDVLSNSMQFDSDLDHSVTKAEFVSGLHRLADTLKKKGESVLTYADLVQPLQQPGAGAQASESGEAPPKGQKSKRVSPS